MYKVKLRSFTYIVVKNAQTNLKKYIIKLGKMIFEIREGGIQLGQQRLVYR